MPTDEPARRRESLVDLATRWARSLELDPASARIVDDGWDFAVLLVDAVWTGSPERAPVAPGRQPWVFRFPRRPEIADALEIELRALPVLHRYLPVAVPRPAVVGLLDDGEHRFAGYPALPGEPLAADLVTGGRGGLVVSQLAGFLAALHRVPTREVVAAGLSRSTVAEWRERLAGVVERAGAVLGQAGVTLPSRSVDRWLAAIADDGCWPDALTVIHGDLGTEHVLADYDRGVLTGVIDWTDARIGDPAMDFADLLRRLGRPATDAILDRYADAVDPPPEEPFVRRIELYVDLMPLYGALHGADTGQPRYVDEAARELAAARRSRADAG
jgi:aminoglycoside phosphotransferase (APT) family kinase protein